jgi:hypothetical protein
MRIESKAPKADWRQAEQFATACGHRRIDTHLDPRRWLQQDDQGSRPEVVALATIGCGFR